MIVIYRSSLHGEGVALFSFVLLLFSFLNKRVKADESGFRLLVNMAD